jgi:hypothetical protein
VLEQIDALNAAQANRAKQEGVLKEAYDTLNECEGLVGFAEKEVARLEKELQQAKVSLADHKEAVKEQKDDIAAQTKALENLPDRSEELAPLREQIATAEHTNSKVRDNQSYDRLAKDVKASRGQWQELTDRLKEIAEERAAAVADAEWPIEGMTLEEDGLLWNGLPFAQASTSQKIMASVNVGMRLNPKLRLLVCEHGSDLDATTIDALDEVLKENQFQCVVEIVTRSKEDEERCAVVIADGEVVGAESPDTDDKD